MSRAFVSESDGLDAEQIPDFLDLLPAGARNYMTAEGAGRLKAELNALLTGERSPLVSLIQRLTAEGNETGALNQAQFDLMVLDKRIEYLSRLVSTMEIVEARKTNTDSIGFGAWVTVRDAGGAQRIYRIVGAYESDPDAGFLSRSSPLAKALMGKSAGELITVKLPEGETVLEVVDVSYAADEA